MCTCHEIVALLAGGGVLSITGLGVYMTRPRTPKKKLMDAESIAYADAWMKEHDNQFESLVERGNLGRYIGPYADNKAWRRRVDFSKDRRGIMIKVHYAQGMFVPTFVIVNDATVTTRLHAIMVDPSCKTPTAGLAWTIGLKPKEYDRVTIES